jgi:hypothetical protein
VKRARERQLDIAENLMRRTYPKTIHPSSARRRACSQARAASAPSTVPPTFPSGPGCEAVSQVFTTRLVLASSL